MNKKLVKTISALTIGIATIATIPLISTACTGNVNETITVERIAAGGSKWDPENKIFTYGNQQYNPASPETGTDNQGIKINNEISDYSQLTKYTLDISKVPEELKTHISIEPEYYSSSSDCKVLLKGWQLQFLEWNPFSITINWKYKNGYKNSYTFTVAAQEKANYALQLSETKGLGGQWNADHTQEALTNISYNFGDWCTAEGWLEHNYSQIEIQPVNKAKYIYNNCFNFIEPKEHFAPVLPGGVFGDLKPGWLFTPTDIPLTNSWDGSPNEHNIIYMEYHFGTEDHPETGHIYNFIIDDYDNNPSWKTDGYKTLQFGNPYTWRSWDKMFYHLYF